MTRQQQKEKKIEDEKKFIESIKNKQIDGETKNKFRKTSFWKEFRKKHFIKEIKKLKNGKEKIISNVDEVTLRPLTKYFDLHHLNLNSQNYTNLDDSQFKSLNSKTHECIHWFYSEYCKDPTFKDRFLNVIELMYKINNGKDVKDFK